MFIDREPIPEREAPRPSTRSTLMSKLRSPAHGQYAPPLLFIAKERSWGGGAGVGRAGCLSEVEQEVEPKDGKYM